MVVRADDGAILAAEIDEYDVLHPRPLWAEQWPDVWLNATIGTIKRALERAKVSPHDVAGIGISGLYGGSGIPVDTEFQPIRPCLIWMDRRATKQVEWLKENIDLDRLFEITGNGVDSYYGFTKMLWLKEHEPQTWGRIHKLVPPNDYVIYHLTGSLVIDHSSAANIGGLYDIRRRCWSEELLQLLGVPLRFLPERIVPSAAIAGYITKEASEQTGLLQGTPVIAGGIDAAVATLSAGVFEPGDHVAMVGTSMCWGTVHDGSRLSPAMVSMPYVVDPERTIYTFGGAATAGALARWFRDHVGVGDVEVDRPGLEGYAYLDSLARQIPPGSEGLLVLPYFMGERSPIWDPMARGAIHGLTLYHTRAHLFRAFLEGVAYALRHNMDYGERLGLPLNPDCFLVGGASKSALWTQIFADVSGYQMRTVDGGGDAPLGDALLAGVATGAVEGYDQIKSWLRLQPPVAPDPSAQEAYRRYYAAYQSAYRETASTMHRLARLGSGDESS